MPLRDGARGHRARGRVAVPTSPLDLGAGRPLMRRPGRIFVAEVIGTMILIIGGPGTAIFTNYMGVNVGTLGVSLAFGLSLLCAAYLFGHISGCHINPAVTVGMWALKRTEGRDVPAYLLGQILGAALGAFVIWAIL